MIGIDPSQLKQPPPPKPRNTHIGYSPKSAFKEHKNFPKKETTFVEGVCNVRFNRKTLPKGGKSVLNGCFIELSGQHWLIWDLVTRASLGICKNEDRLDLVTKSLQERFKVLKDTQ